MAFLFSTGRAILRCNALGVPRHNASLRKLLSSLAIVEIRQGKITAETLNAITAASKLGGDVTGFVAGGAAKEIAAEAAKIAGIKKVIEVSNPAYDHFLAENTAPLIAENITKGGFTHVFAPSSSSSKNILPRVGALLDVQPMSDIIAIESEDTFKRPVYAGNAIETIKSKDPIKLMTIRSSAFEAASADSGNTAPVEAGADPNAPSPTEFVSQQIVKSERPDLGSAKVVVSGGRALKDKATFDKVIYPLADALHAAVGASRAAVDSGFCDNSLQVGQTGKVVAPDLYVAVGISGAIQHLAGMKDSKTIVAINKDEEAPIFQIADYGLVGDIYKLVPELTEKLQALEAK